MITSLVAFLQDCLHALITITICFNIALPVFPDRGVANILLLLICF